ncbi:MAG: polysaccharide biosynthesis/export family protein, partial [Planctomycetota bacterium]
MKAVSKQIVLALAAAPLLLTALGCSALGFSAVPVAHLMTSDTREVLEQTSKLPAVPRELAKEPLAAYYLQPGDELLIDVMTSSDVQIPTDQRVLSDGSIDLGSVGRIVVSGMTLEQTEAELRRALLTNVDDIDEDELTVNAQLIQPIQRFYVVGEVNAPGAYPLVGFETVLDGIMEAGGLTARASACDILLARPTSPCSCRVTLPVCYRAITQLGDTTTNYHLRPGDRIFVARQSFSEELMAYVSGAEPCPRCCRDPAACCDPR